MNINTLKNRVFAVVLIGICLLGIIFPKISNADLPSTTATFVAKATNKASDVVKTIDAVITAYSSSVDETDDTPFITASGKHVAENIVANNMLPLGTKIRIPDIFGDKVLTVGDRLNAKKKLNHFDLWKPSKQMAINFGVKKNVKVEVLED